MFSFDRLKKDDNAPKYYICARRDNGFVPAYRAYFFIHGNKIKKVSVFRYEHQTVFGNKADEFQFFSPNHCVFSIKAENNNPSDWKIVQNQYDKVKYDVNTLIMLLKQTRIIVTGFIQLVLNEFDGYVMIHMASTDQEGHGMILREQSLFFKDGSIINIDKKIHFDDVRDFYRYVKEAENV